MPDASVFTIDAKKRLDETKQLTGFPGNAKNRQSLILPNVVGLPGFILSRPKNTYPFNSIYGLIRSSSPMETPPLVTITSQPISSMAR